MTSESASSTEPWVEQHGAEYAYAYDKANALMRGVGASGLPSAILVDASGNIAWLGHPGGLPDEEIAKALEGALAKPVFEWPKELSSAAKMLRKGDLGGAVLEVESKGEAHADVATSLRAQVAARLAALERAREAGDWLRVSESGEALAKGLGKLPEAEQVEAILEALKKDKDAQVILKAQEKIAKALSGDIKKTQIERLQRDFERIRDEHPGTAAERDAKRALERLRGMRD